MAHYSVLLMATVLLSTATWALATSHQGEERHPVSRFGRRLHLQGPAVVGAAIQTQSVAVPTAVNGLPGQVVFPATAVNQGPGQVLVNPGQAGQVFFNPGQAVVPNGQVFVTPGQAVIPPGQVFVDPGQAVVPPVNVLQGDALAPIFERIFANSRPGVMDFIRNLFNGPGFNPPTVVETNLG